MVSRTFTASDHCALSTNHPRAIRLYKKKRYYLRRNSICSETFTKGGLFFVTDNRECSQVYSIAKEGWIAKLFPTRKSSRRDK